MIKFYYVIENMLTNQYNYVRTTYQINKSDIIINIIFFIVCVSCKYYNLLFFFFTIVKYIILIFFKTIQNIKIIYNNIIYIFLRFYFYIFKITMFNICYRRYKSNED